MHGWGFLHGFVIITGSAYQHRRTRTYQYGPGAGRDRHLQLALRLGLGTRILPAERRRSVGAAKNHWPGTGKEENLTGRRRTGPAEDRAGRGPVRWRTAGPEHRRPGPLPAQSPAGPARRSSAGPLLRQPAPPPARSAGPVLRQATPPARCCIQYRLPVQIPLTQSTDAAVCGHDTSAADLS